MDEIRVFFCVFAVVLVGAPAADAQDLSTPIVSEGASGYPSTAAPSQPARAVRLSLSLSSIDLFIFPMIAGLSFSLAASPDQFMLGDRVLTDTGWWVYGGAATAMAGVALFGVVRSGKELVDRKKGRANQASLTWPRTGIALASVSASYWTALAGVGFAFRRGANAAVSLALLAFAGLQFWALAWNAKELKRRKYGMSSTHSKFRMVAPGFFVF